MNSSLTGFIFDIRKYSIHDGPGIRTTVFMKGCPLDCWWCHNPEGRSTHREVMLRPARCIRCGTCVDVCAREAVSVRSGDGVILTDRSLCDACGDCIATCYADARQWTGREMSVADVMAEVERDLPFYEQSGGGVTFSGGEPMLQRDFLMALLQECRAKGICTALDTSGYASWSGYESLLGLVDDFLFDVKLVDEERHLRFVGVPNQLILSNLRRLLENGQRVLLRMPVIPGINDDGEHLRQVAALVKSLPSAPALELLAYHDTARNKYEGLGLPYRLNDTRPPSASRMNEIAATLRGEGLTVLWK